MGSHLLKSDLFSARTHPQSVSQSVKQSVQDLGHPRVAQGVALLPRTTYWQGKEILDQTHTHIHSQHSYSHSKVQSHTHNHRITCRHTHQNLKLQIPFLPLSPLSFPESRKIKDIFGNTHTHKGSNAAPKWWVSLHNPRF